MNFKIGLLVFLSSSSLLFGWSGNVVDSNGVGVKGVTIRIRNLVAETDGNGAWNISPTVSILKAEKSVSGNSPNIVSENGDLKIGFMGRDLLGRFNQVGKSRRAEYQEYGMRQMATVDTMLVSWNRKTLWRVKVSREDSVFQTLIDTAWRDDAGIPWNPSVSFRSCFDARDGQTYRTLAMGDQLWFAENLNYRVDSSWCWGGNGQMCDVYGRLYNWTAAMSLGPDYLHKRLPQDSIVQGACPEGWRVPTTGEWDAMTRASDTGAGAAQRLASVSPWQAGFGLDRLGFRALPGGNRQVDGKFLGTIGAGIWWTATQSDYENSYAKYIFYLSAAVKYDRYPKEYAASVRCIKSKQ